MKPFKSTLSLLFLLIATHAFSQYTDVINSNRPGVSRSAFSVGKNVVQFEVGPYFVKEKRTPATSYEDTGFGADFSVRYGFLFEQLEINIEGNYQNDKREYTYRPGVEDTRSNFKFLSIGAKYLIFDPYKNEEANKPNLYSWKANHNFKWRGLIPAISVYLGGNYDTKNNPYTAPGIEGFSPKIMVATQNNFAGGWVFVMNLIKDRIGTDQSDFQYIFTLTHSFNPQWVIFGEAQGIKSDFYADNLIRVGGARLLGKNFQLDGAITFNTKDTPSVFNASLGASYRLDFHKDPIPDNGNNAIEEGKRKERSKAPKTKKFKKKRKNNSQDEEKTKKQKKKEVDFE